MTFALGPTSMTRLQGVHASLVGVVELAIGYSAQDFTVQEGVRTLAQQRVDLASGVSKTLASKHLVQPDGFGHAVDLVPWVNGAAVWSWPLIYPIVVAMKRAAAEKSVVIIWGGVWDRFLGDLPADALGIQHACAAYCTRHPGPDFIDGPHFQI